MSDIVCLVRTTTNDVWEVIETDNGHGARPAGTDKAPLEVLRLRVDLDALTTSPQRARGQVIIPMAGSSTGYPTSITQAWLPEGGDADE